MRVRLFGVTALMSGTGEPIRFATRKGLLSLAALVLSGPKGTRREVLSAVLWPDREDVQARASLRQALLDLRRALSKAAVRLETDGEAIALAADPADVDVWLFDRLQEKGDLASLAAAAELYQTDILADLAIPAQLEEWFNPHRRFYRRKALQLVEKLSLTASAPDELNACESLAERLLACDPLSEEGHRALIRVYQRQNRMNAAARQFALCKEALRRELGVEPESQTSNLFIGSPPATEPTIPNSQFAATATPAKLTAVMDCDQPSIIVMPFDNLSGPADEPFVDGVVEEITATLSRVRDFFVIARQSAFAFKGRFVDVREIGQELGVRYVLEGTVRRAGDRVRITVQLVNAATRTQFWSERYEGSTADIFEFQDRIAMQVAGAMHPAVLGAEIEAARRKPPDSLRAYEFVLQAYPKIWSATAAENGEAINLLMRALAVDPTYARAHALLAWCYSQEVVYLWSADPQRDRHRARLAIEAAAGSIWDDPMAMTAVGAALTQSHEHDRAAAYIEGALALDPNHAWAWARYGWLAIFRDEPEKAKQHFERAQALSPLDPLTHNVKIGIAFAVGGTGDYVKAAQLIQSVLDQYPQVTWVYRQLAAYAALAGDLTTARRAVKSLLASHPKVSIALMNTHHPARQLPHIYELLLKGWRLAGLPET